MPLSYPGIRSVTCVAFAMLLLPTIAASQDVVLTMDGQKIRGDVVSADDVEVHVVDKHAKLHKVPRGEVKLVKRARAKFKPEVAERLEKVASSPENWLRVATWALTDRKFKKGAKLLLSRVIAYEPDNEPAREAAGHVLVDGAWITSPKEAYKLTKETMPEQGYVYYKGGWALKSLVKYVKKSPEDWMRHRGLIWRLITEVRKERGEKVWKNEWYSKKDARLVKTLRSIRDESGDELHAAQTDSTYLFGPYARDTAYAMAVRQKRAREWFVKTFDVEKHKKTLIKRPHLVDYVFTSKEAFKKFLDKNRRFARSQASYEQCQKTGNFCSGANYGAWNHGEGMPWRLASSAGMRMSNMYWRGGPDPDWLSVAIAHHTEIAILGDIRVQWVHVGGYGNEKPVPELKGRGMKELKSTLIEVYGNTPMPGLRALMSKDMNELNDRLDLLGTVYLKYLLENHREKLIQFMIKPKGKNRVERFEAHFGMTFEALDQQFRAWLGN